MRMAKPSLLVGERLPGNDSGAGLSSHNSQCLPVYLWNCSNSRLAHMAPNLTPSTGCATSLSLFLFCVCCSKCLGNTSTTDATGTQYKIEFQYDTTALTVMAFSKGGRLPFDPR